MASESAAAVLPWAVDGSRRAFRVRSTPMRDADGRLVGAVTLLEDVTHLSEISRLKSEFIAAASHELRTPLTSVQMGIHLLLEGAAGTLDRRQQDILEVCREDTERLDRLMRQLLDLSKIESGASTPVDRPFARRSSCGRRPMRCGCRSRRAGFASSWTRRRIYRRSLAGSRSDRAGDRQPGHQRAARDAGWRDDHDNGDARDGDVAFSSRDTGAGIPRDYLPRIFEPFVQVPTRRRVATGLGLTISRRIVEAHGGQLTVQSDPGRDPRSPLPFRSGEEQPAEKPRMKLLIVDDEPHIRQMIRLTLETSRVRG